MKKLEFETDIAVAHNGVISKYTPSKNNNKYKMNDTQMYIYNKMYKYTNNNMYRQEKTKKIISKN